MSSFDQMLIHQLSLVRQVAVLDGSGDPTNDEYGQPIREPLTIATVACDIQTKSVRERAQLSGAGVTVGGWTAFMRPTDLTSADELQHVAALCPAYPDHPDAIFQVLGIRPIRDGTGIHHYEIDGELVEAPLAVGS